MSDLPWAPDYAGQTLDELFALESKFSTASIANVFFQAIGAKRDRFGKEGLSEEEEIFFAIHYLRVMVDNGGYAAFFYHSTNEHVYMIVEALIRIGCPAAAEITKDAIDALKIDGPLTTEAVARAIIDEQNEKLDARLCDADKQYFELGPGFTRPLLEFIKSNREKFRIGK